MSPQDQATPSILESCLAAAAKLRQVQQLLLEPGTLDRSAAELNEVIATLEQLVSASSPDWGPAESASLHQIKRAAGRLRAQIEHASNLWAGWLQLRMGTGYTEQGLPVFVNHEAGSCFEG